MRWLTFVVLALIGCETDDIGKKCEPQGGEPLPAEPVGGEQPINEIVELQRNGDCQSFQCLTHRGYAPYCTRTCAYSQSGGRTCTSDADCKHPRRCHEGECTEQDCPAGFTCQSVQDVGPLAGKLFCVVKEGCGGSTGQPSNFECEAVGKIECKRVACYDGALTAGTADAAHALTCVDKNDLAFCGCDDGSEFCADDRFICDPEGAERWPAGTVKQRDVCLRKDP